ncbi:MAG: type IV secretion system protein [Neisseria sp.]|uniref:type IV secretion system protein n=1 Tax=Neisseria sp. TaxID=192066 RepID=UPI0026DBD993|nr:type IV secretion system protein [Neisseria sp.]MDO4248196.1 type IV secretion system protein [Neisseria sp.]
MKLKPLKKTIVATMVSVGLVFGSVTPASASGIPTFDGAAAANAIQSLIQMKTQIENQIKQLTELKSQVQAMTGSRNMGNLLKDAVKSQIPSEWSSLYDSVKNTDYKSVLNGKSYKPETALQLLANNEAMSKAAYEELSDQLEKIDQLREEINNTQDIKAATDLQNRIATEQAKINNTQIQLDMMDRFYAQQEKIEKKKYAMREACMARHMYDRKFEECNN